jgi:hypothetical protein
MTQRAWTQGAMHTAKQPAGGWIGRIRPVHRLRIIGIDQNQFACADAGEMHLVGVHQKAAAVRIDHERKMIGHGLMHARGAPSSGTYR